MSEWQPIETAPKDGTPVLVCGGTATLPCEWENIPIQEATIACFHNRQWNGDVTTDGNCWRLNPDYWMPLPTPPEAK